MTYCLRLQLCTSLGALGGKAKVMVWPEAVLYPAIAAGDEEHEAAEEEERAAEEEERALEAEFEAASVEVVEQPAAAMDLQPPMDPPREFILMIMPNEHVKSNKKLNCSPTTLADLAAQVGTACKVSTQATPPQHDFQGRFRETVVCSDRWRGDDMFAGGIPDGCRQADVARSARFKGEDYGVAGIEI